MNGVEVQAYAALTNGARLANVCVQDFMAATGKARYKDMTTARVAIYSASLRVRAQGMSEGFDLINMWTPTNDRVRGSPRARNCVGRSTRTLDQWMQLRSEMTGIHRHLTSDSETTEVMGPMTKSVCVVFHI